MASQPEESHESAGDPNLKLLKQPWSAELTEDQRQRQRGIEAGKAVWDFVMKKYFERINRAQGSLEGYGTEEDDENDASSQADEESRESKDDEVDPHSFLALPTELRLIIYNFVLADERDVRKTRQRRLRSHTPPPRPVFNRRGYRPRLAPRTIYQSPKKNPKLRTREQTRMEAARRSMLYRLGTRRLSRLGSLGRHVPGDREAFEQYRLQHETYTRRCWHEDDHEEADEPDHEMEDEEEGDGDDGDEAEDDNASIHEYDDASVVYVNARGNLCDDLPMLALTCRQVLCEIWNQIYPRLNRATRYHATIRSLNFSPFFRFCQMLGKSPLKILDVSADLVDIRFDTKLRGKDEALHAKTFQHVKRLIELHWLHGFPLWGVLTGLSSNGTNPRNPFTDFMYSVRQIVALWRVDNQKWRLKSTEYLARCLRIEGHKIEITESYWRQRTDGVIIEAIIEMLVKAVEYRLGYEGSWSPVGRDKSEWHKKQMEMFRFQGDHRKVAYQKEHSVARMVDMYCEDVDERLRHVLRDRYEEWEMLPDSAAIPQDVLL